MDRIDFDFSAGQRELIDEQIARGSYADLNEYVADALRRDGERLAQEKLGAMLAEGMEGEALPSTDAFWDDLRKEARGEH